MNARCVISLTVALLALTLSAGAALAGKHQAVGFGVRYYVGKYPVRLRRADEAPKDPDVYQSANGIFRGWNPDGLMGATDGLVAQSHHGETYQPIQALLAHK